MPRHPPHSTLFPYTTLFRSQALDNLEDTPENRKFKDAVAGAVAKYKGMGVRVEDSFLLTANGLKRLSATTPRTIEEIERHIDRKSTRLNSSHLGISYAVFCLNATPSTPLYALSLHDALPISGARQPRGHAGEPQVQGRGRRRRGEVQGHGRPRRGFVPAHRERPEAPVGHDAADDRGDRAAHRSEEHTSELQSLRHLVCRLLLECHAIHPTLRSFPTRRSSDLRRSTTSRTRRRTASSRTRSPAPWRSTRAWASASRIRSCSPRTA